MRRKVRSGHHLGVGASRLTAIHIPPQVRGHSFPLMTFLSQKAPLATKTNISTNATQMTHVRIGRLELCQKTCVSVTGKLGTTTLAEP